MLDVLVTMIHAVAVVDSVVVAVVKQVAVVYFFQY
jgi:hypothetical protein